MKEGSFIINTARGALIDEIALSVQLEKGNISGAALDILEDEPPNPKSPILKSPNVIITPHIGGSTFECLEKVASIASLPRQRPTLPRQLPQYHRRWQT